jgi:PKD repeat protein
VVASASVEGGVAPLTVEFSAEGMCTDANGVLTWSFGDGSAPTHEPNPTHIYTKPGSYTARVTLADDEHHASDSDEAPVTVTAP